MLAARAALLRYALDTTKLCAGVGALSADVELEDDQQVVDRRARTHYYHMRTI